MKAQVRKSIGDINVERIKRALALVRRPDQVALFSHYRLSPGWSLKRFAVNGHEVFFGYYEKRQLSLDCNRLLAGAVSSRVAGSSEPDDVMRVGWFDVESGQFKDIATTTAFNWQQGCMLRWVPATQDRKVMFNDWRGGAAVSVVVDAETGAQERADLPAAYDCAPCGTLIATCDFGILHRLRLGYGYWQAANLGQGTGHPTRQTSLVQVLEWDGGALRGRVTLGDVEATLGIEVTPSQVYVNHLSFSPESKKLFFLFFWKDAAEPQMAALYLDLDDNELKIITRRYMSHYCWEDDDLLVAWGAGADGTMGYFRYKLQENEQEPYWTGLGLSDGHCTIDANGSMLTDTYPDALGMQELMVRTAQGRVDAIGSFHSPAKFMLDRRCDLHPRLTAREGCFTFDSGCGGRRATYLVQRS